MEENVTRLKMPGDSEWGPRRRIGEEENRNLGAWAREELTPRPRREAAERGFLTRREVGKKTLEREEKKENRREREAKRTHSSSIMCPGFWKEGAEAPRKSEMRAHHGEGKEKKRPRGTKKKG